MPAHVLLRGPTSLRLAILDLGPRRKPSLWGRNPQHANDNDAFIPEIWAQEGLVILEENMVAANLVHRDFENEIRDFGDVVNTRRPGTFKIKRKIDGTPLSQQDANATNVRVPLDQWFYNSFTIKDGEASKSFQELVDVQQRRCSPSLAVVIWAFHREAVALATRPLALPNERMGVMADVAVHNDIAMRVSMQYDIQNGGTVVNLDILAGVAVLERLAVVVLS